MERLIVLTNEIVFAYACNWKSMLIPESYILAIDWHIIVEMIAVGSDGRTAARVCIPGRGVNECD